MAKDLNISNWICKDIKIKRRSYEPMKLKFWITIEME